MKTDFEALLDPNDAALWTAYRADERHQQRRQALARLHAFVDRLLTYPPARRDQFAAVVCHAVVDAGSDLPIRHPLFVTILFPYLVRAVERREEHAARWMAHFYDHVIRWHDGREWLVVHAWDRRMLLQEALARNPADGAVRRELIAVMARQFEDADP